MTIKYLDSKRISSLSSDYTLGTNNGTIFANWDYVLYGGSAEFDGSNDNIKFGDNTDWNFMHNSGSWTASFWMKPDDISVDRMVFNNNGTTSTNIGVQCLLTSSNTLRTRIGNGSGDWVTVTHGSFSVNTWYFVVITFDGTTLSVKSSSYGGSLSSATTGTVSGSASSANSLSPMTLGSASDNNTTYPFDGHINVFMIWDRVLTSAEINTLYGGGTGSTSYSESGLVLRTCLQITGESLQWFDNQVVKPTNVQDNSILVEKDTGERYWFDAEISNLALTDPTPASSDYTNSGSSFTFASNKIHVDAVGYGSTLTMCTRPLTTTFIPTTNGCMIDFKFDWTTAGGSGNDTGVAVGIFDTRDQADNTNNGIWIEFVTSPSYARNVQFKCEGVFDNSSVQGYPVPDEYYCRIIVQKDGSATGKGYTSEADRTADTNAVFSRSTATQTGFSEKTIFGIINTRPTGGGNVVGDLDSIDVYSGITATTPATWTNPVCASTISSTATMGSNGDFDVEYTTVASKTGSGQRGCNAWEFDGLSTSPYTGRNAVKGATNADFAVSSSTAFTIAAWVKLNTLGQQHTILGYSGAYTNTFWTNLGISASNKVEAHTATNGISNNYIPTGNSLSVDTWHHCVFVHKADKSVTVYLDADTANKGTGTGDTGSASSGFWTIAGRWGHAVTIPTFPFLDGFIDQATLWNVALSETDVINLYNGGRLTPPSVSQNNIKGYWTFSETSGAAENKAV